MLVILLISAALLFINAEPAAAQINPIVQENSLPGTNSWKLDEPNISNKSDYDILMQIKGYTSPASINKGESINFHIHVSSAQSYTAEIYRIGWYNGAGGRLMQTIGPLTGTPQPAPAIDTTTGMVTANWSPSYALTVPTSWTSGMYLVKLENSSGYENYMVFTVRDDARTADFLYQHAVTTSHAYNNFPNNGVLGKSLYRYNSYGANTPLLNDRRAFKVSFDRPFADRGDGLLFNWEYDLILWLEKEGYDVAYSTNTDLHNNPGSLLNYRGFISAGHDEYWTKEMFDAAETARDAGIHLAFMGSNAVYWQSRLEDNDRTLVVYKNSLLDPVYNQDPGLATNRFRDIGRPEQTLIGIQYKTYTPSFSDNTAYIVQNSDHWIYANSTFVDGSQVPQIIGYEIDNLDPNYAAPPDNGSQVFLSNSPFINFQNQLANQTSSIYRASSGAWVFGSGTMSWSWALNRNGYINGGIQQVTKNLLDRFLADSTPPNNFLLGDANCSDSIDSVDALAVLQYAVDIRTDVGSCPLANGATELNAPAGDVNADNNTDAVDALLILQCQVGITNLFCPSE